MLRWLLLCSCLAPLGCTATCLRNSDCMGASTCTDNRCILIVGADAGGTTTTTNATPNPATTTPSDTSNQPSNDAGSPN
jgi:hypothetical protein